MSLVSVMMPCYNSESYLEETLESLCRQTCGDFELVAVNDGSRDRTPEILCDWARRDPRFIVFDNPRNLGLSATRRRALEFCRSEFLAFLDSDDLWREDKLRQQLDFLAAHPELHAVHSNSTVIDPRGRPTGETFRTLYPQGKVLAGDLFPHLVLSNYLNTTSLLVRTEPFRAAGGFPAEVSHNEDWLAWIRFARDHRFGYLDECLSSYRVHPQNVSKNEDAYAESRCLIFRLLLADYGRDFSRRLRSRVRYLLGCNLAQTRSIPAARAEFFAAFRDWPLNWKAAAKYILARLKLA